LIEAQAEKRKREDASEVGVEWNGTSRSKSERIMVKMVRSTSSAEGRTKSIVKGGTGGVMNRSIVKLYSCSSRARGLLNYIFFF
jgi:hypothetical protein